MADRQVLPSRRLSVTETFELDGQQVLYSIGFDRKGFAREIFINGNKVGTQLESLLQSVCLTLSLLLREHNSAEHLRRRIGLPGSVADQLLARAAQIEATCQAGILEAYREHDRRVMQ